MARAIAPFRKKIIINDYRVRFGAPRGRDSVLMYRTTLRTGEPNHTNDINAANVILGNINANFHDWYTHMRKNQENPEPFFLHVSGDNLYLRMKKHITGSPTACTTIVLSKTPSVRAAQITAAKQLINDLHAMCKMWNEFAKRAR